ncbi:hypothetical protein H0H93_000749 [Arthromyces matolae]|nr:hypothetical protein H0H93_000749 [Arthromyces matolae]
MAATRSAQKRVMRKAVSATLKSLSSSSIEDQSRAVVARVLDLPAFQHSRSVSCYLSMPSGELDTSPLISEILGRGKTLFVPKIDSSKDGHMDFLRVYGKDDLDTFQSGLWGIREPESQWQGSQRENALVTKDDPLDLILVPGVMLIAQGVAFDHSFSRLGHGKGYYDRFITTYTTTKSKPLLVALALREQVFQKGEVPIAPHDWSMDIIVTPDQTLIKE